MNKLNLTCLMFALMVICPSVFGQNLNSIKTSVVRIKNERRNETGAGFIVKIEGTRVYVVTAAHVVADQHPSVYLFNQQHDPLPGTVLDMDSENSNGLAILFVNASRELISGLTALKLRSTSDLGNAESVKILGFPGGVSLWTVEAGNITRLGGNNLVLSGNITEGNSGGPVVLGDTAVGLVTTVNQSGKYAVRAEIIATYVNGIVGNLVSLQSSNSIPSPDPTPLPNTLLAQLKDSIWLEHDVKINGEDVYLEFESNGKVRTRTVSDRSGYVASNVKWQIQGNSLLVQLFDDKTNKVQNERSGILNGDRIEGSHKNFITGSKSKWLLTKASGIPDLGAGSRPELCQSLQKLIDASKNDFYPLVGEPNKSGVFSSNYAFVDSLSGRVIPQKGVFYRMMEDGDRGKIVKRFHTLVSEVSLCLKRWDEKDEADSSYRYHKFRQPNETTIVEVYYNPVAQNGKYYLLFDVVIPGQGRSEW